MSFLSKLFTPILNRHDAGTFRNVPIDEVSGKLYTSPMPYGAYDRSGRLIKIYSRNEIDHVMMLVTREELIKKARKNLLALYKESGIGYSQFEMIDFQAPTIELMNQLVTEARILLTSGKKIAIHCHAGVGRTATAVCCIITALTKLTPQQAIEHASHHMTVNITSEQKTLVTNFCKKYGHCDSLE